MPHASLLYSHFHSYAYHSDCYADPAPVVLIDSRFDEIGVVVNIRENARFKLRYVWLTYNGDKSTAPDWAQPWMNFPEVGADHAVFGVIVGTAQPADFRLWWPDDGTLRSAAGWVNIPIYDKCYTKGSCAYNFRFDGGDEVLKVGLWQGVHTSYFGVWVDTQPSLTTVNRPMTDNGK